MGENFDPYYKWLGIPPKDQPPTHYRLLGIELLESDREVIDAAANRLMAYLKTLSAGEDATHAQRLLEEAAVARRCLLDPQLRAEYDARLPVPKALPRPAAVMPSGSMIAAGFDPYYKWLGIPPKHQPPTHYRLLGIEPFESDRAVIDSAADRLMAHLKSLSTGDDATHAQRLLSAAAIARRCLLDPRLKTEYDAQLHAANASPAAPSRSPAVGPARRPVGGLVTATPADCTDASSGTIGAASKRRAQERSKAARRKQQTVLLASIATGVAIAIVWIGLALSSGGGTAERQASRPASPAAKHAKQESESARVAAPPRQRLAEGDSPTSRPASFAGKVSLPEAKPTENGEAVPTVTPSEAENPVAARPIPAAVATSPPTGAGELSMRPTVASPPVSAPPAPLADPFARLGTVLDLPSARPKSGAAPGPATLGALPVVNLHDVQFTLLGADRVFGHSAKATMAAVAGANPARWRVELCEHDGDPQSLAEFCVQTGQLQFSWTATDDCSHADLLRNCFLQISADQHQQCFALRQPQAVAPLTIQNEKGDPQSHAIPVAAIPIGLPCQLEIIGISGPEPYYSIYRPPLLSPAGKPSNMQWSVPGINSPICAQIWLDPATAGGLVIRTRLLMQPPNGKKTKSERGFVSREGKDLIRKLAATIKQYDANHPRTIAARLGSSPAPQAIAAYENQYAAQHQEQLDQLSYWQRLDALSADKNLRESIRIHIRVFTMVDDHRLDLVRSEPEAPVKK